MRTMFTGLAVAVIAAGLSAPASAETKPGTPAPAQAQAEKAKPVKDKIYCVKGEVTGSRLLQKDCRTRAEWLQEGFDPLDPK
jgi:hypothetical protein